MEQNETDMVVVEEEVAVVMEDDCYLLVYYSICIFYLPESAIKVSSLNTKLPF